MGETGRAPEANGPEGPQDSSKEMFMRQTHQFPISLSPKGEDGLRIIVQCFLDQGIGTLHKRDLDHLKGVFKRACEDVLLKGGRTDEFAFVQACQQSASVVCDYLRSLIRRRIIVIVTAIRVHPTVSIGRTMRSRIEPRVTRPSHAMAPAMGFTGGR